MESMDDVCDLGLKGHNLGDDTTTQKWPGERLGEEVFYVERENSAGRL